MGLNEEMRTTTKILALSKSELGVYALGLTKTCLEAKVITHDQVPEMIELPKKQADKIRGRKNGR